MATQEARAMLDALMGGDRNAPLPKGAALPGRLSDSDQLLLQRKRKKSCYDKDIDPLYTAWGVDCYDLFVNTKSDLGANPNVVDRAAHEEFVQLPQHEQERLGYNYFLFQKLSELVRQCDRMVSRNKEKLKQELNRKLSQRGGQDFVQDVDEAAVEQLARGMIAIENMKSDLNAKLIELDEIAAKEDDRKAKLEPLLEAKRATLEDTPTLQNESDETTALGPVSEDAAQQEGEKETESQSERDALAKDATEKLEKPSLTEDESRELDALQTELGQLTLQRQRLVFDIAQIIALVVPQQDAVESQRRHLNYVKSDISTDKTVCEVSGNFMSSRDADERIAAHYAGKQYVGWRLVRDKLDSMIKQYGRYGPPPPGRGGGDGQVPAPQRQQHHPPPGGERGGPPLSGRGGSGYYGSGGANSNGRDYSRDGGYRSSRGSGGGDRNSSGRWERSGPSGPYHGRDYDDRDRRLEGPAPPGRGTWRR